MPGAELLKGSAWQEQLDVIAGPLGPFPVPAPGDAVQAGGSVLAPGSAVGQDGGDRWTQASGCRGCGADSAPRQRFACREAINRLYEAVPGVKGAWKKKVGCVPCALGLGSREQWLGLVEGQGQAGQGVGMWVRGSVWEPDRLWRGEWGGWRARSCPRLLPRVSCSVLLHTPSSWLVCPDTFCANGHWWGLRPL